MKLWCGILSSALRDADPLNQGGGEKPLSEELQHKAKMMLADE